MTALMVPEVLHLDTALRTPGWMADNELVWLAQQAQSAVVIVEVGSWLGRSTVALADNTEGVVFAVDHWRGTPGDLGHAAKIRSIGVEGLYGAFLANMNGRVDTGRVIPLRMDAEAAAQRFAPQSVDLVFIDASHRYADVKRDIEAYRPLVKPGGILCGHDYACPSHRGVTQAVDEFFPTVNRAGLSIWWVRL